MPPGPAPAVDPDTTTLHTRNDLYLTCRTVANTGATSAAPLRPARRPLPHKYGCSDALNAVLGGRRTTLPTMAVGQTVYRVGTVSSFF